MLFSPKQRIQLPRSAVNVSAGRIASAQGFIQTSATGYTVMLWAYYISAPADYTLCANTNGGASYCGLGADAGNDLGVYSDGSTATLLISAGSLVLKTWYCLGWTCTSTVAPRGYFRQKGSKFTFANAPTAPLNTTTTDTFCISNDLFASGSFNGYYSGVKIWKRVLSDSELYSESSQLAPLSQSKLASYLPLRLGKSAINDEFLPGNKGNGWTVATGSLTNAPIAPPIPEVRKSKSLFYISHGASGSIAATMNSVFAESGTLNGAGALTSTQNAVFAESGTLKGAGALASTSNAIFAESGTLAGAGTLASTQNAIFAESGTLTATGALVSTQNAIFAESGTLAGAGALASESDAVFAESGTLIGIGPLASTQNAIFAESGTLAGGGALVSTQNAVFTESGTLSATGALASESDAVFAESGTLTGAGAVASTSNAVFAESGTLLGSGPLASTQNAVFAESGTLTGNGALASTQNAIFTESGTLAATGALASESDATFTESGTLTGDGALSSTQNAVFAESGTLTATGALASESDAVFAESGTLKGAGALASESDAVFGLISNAVQGAVASTSNAVFTESGTLTGNGALSSTQQAVFAESGTLGAQGALEAALDAVFGESGTLTAQSPGVLASTSNAVFTESGTLEPFVPPPPPPPQRSKATVGPDLPPVTYQEPWWVDPLGQDTPNDIPLRFSLEEAPLVIVEERGIETPYEVIFEPEPGPETFADETLGEEPPTVLIDQSTKVYAPNQSTTTTNITNVYAAPLVAPSTWLDRGKKIAAWVGVMALSAATGFLVAVNVKKAPKRRRPKPKTKRKGTR